MEFFEVLGKRHSCRSYLGKGVEEGKLKKIMEAVEGAPSAGGLQAYSVIIVKGEADRKRLAEAALGQEFVGEAPVDLVFFAEPEKSAGKYGERGRGLFAVQDATLAAGYAQLAAVAQGLSCAWVGAFFEGEVKRICGVKGGAVPVAIIPVGYGKE